MALSAIGHRPSATSLTVACCQPPARPPTHPPARLLARPQVAYNVYMVVGNLVEIRDTFYKIRTNPAAY